MSTRCQIGIYNKKEDKLEDFEVLIYRHSDGYPGTVSGSQYGVLQELVPFLKYWKKTRGISDTEYCGARLLQKLTNTYDGDMLEIEKDRKEKMFTGILGYGICKTFHSDIEYFYKVYPDEVQVFSVDDFLEERPWTPIKMTLIKTIKI